MSRMNAVYRLLGLLYLSTIGVIVALVASIAGSIYMIVDVLWQLITGGEGLTSNNLLARLFQWQIDQAKYIFIGDPKQWPWTP